MSVSANIDGTETPTITLQTQKATVNASQTDVIVPGIDALGTHVWLRYQDQVSNQPKQTRFQTPLHVNLGNTAAIIKLLGIVEI